MNRTTVLILALGVLLFVVAVAPRVSGWAAPVPKPIFDPATPKQWPEIEKKYTAEVRANVKTLSVVAADPKREKGDRRKAVSFLAKIGTVEAMNYLVSAISMKLDRDEMTPVAERPCVQELRGIARDNWLLAKILLDSLDAPRGEDELTGVAVVLKAAVGINLAIATVEQHLGVGGMEAAIRHPNLRVVLRELRKNP